MTLLLALLVQGAEIDRLGSTSPEERAAAEAALAKRGREALLPLEKAAAEHGDPEVRARAKSLAARIGRDVCGEIALVDEAGEVHVVNAYDGTSRKAVAVRSGRVHEARWMAGRKWLLLLADWPDG
jgi:HEAT repeat protein